MKLISCEIAGFGRISELNIDFTQGINVWLEENGWGKTTLTVFLKSIFYGMEYSRRRGLSEREHYRPWEGGRSYGGSVTFESERGIYRIERFFGKRDTDDEFRLYDVKTGLLSEDYTSDIGQELFLVDRASFEKSIFIPQNAIATGMTDSLNAKMGDMSSAADDINNFDLAIRRLEDARRIYTKNSRLDPGRLIAVRQDIRACREAVERIPTVEEALDKQRLVLEEKKEDLKEKHARKEILKRQIKEQSVREQELGVYTEKKQTYNTSHKVLTGLEKFFENGFCSRDELDKMDELERRLEMDREHLGAVNELIPEEDRIRLLESLFKDGNIDQGTIETWDAKSRRIFELRVKGEHTGMTDEEKARLKELRAYFAWRNPSGEELERAMQDADRLAQLDGQVEALNEQYRNAAVRLEMQRENDEADRGPRGFLYGLLAAFVLAAGAVAFYVFFGGASGRLFAAGSMASAVVVTAAVVYNLLRGKKERKERLRLSEEALGAIEEQRRAGIAERERQREICRSFLDGFLVSPADSYAQMIGEIQQKKGIYDRLNAQEQKYIAAQSGVLEELSSIQLELYTELSGCAAIYGLDLYDEHKEAEVLSLLKEDLKEYEDFCSNLNQKQELDASVSEAEEELDSFIKRFDVPVKSPKEQLLEIRGKLEHYYVLKNRLDGLKNDIDRFESSYNINEETKSVARLQAEEAGIDARIVALNEQLVNGNNTQNELSDELEQLQETADRLEGLEELEAKYRTRTERIEKAITYLTRAKESFLARYMDPLRKRMMHYLELVCANDGEASAGIRACDVTLDMDLGIRLDHNGSRKELEYLSSGYQDLLSVCARFALVDVLYREEKPFLILDDPFANLDESRLGVALKLIEDLGKERQIIYFTCHASRLPHA